MSGAVTAGLNSFTSTWITANSGSSSDNGFTVTRTAGSVNQQATFFSMYNVGTPPGTVTFSVVADEEDVSTFDLDSLTVSDSHSYSVTGNPYIYEIKIDAVTGSGATVTDTYSYSTTQADDQAVTRLVDIDESKFDDIKSFTVVVSAQSANITLGQFFNSLRFHGMTIADPKVASANAAPTIDGIASTAAVTTGVASALPDFTVADTDAGDTLTVTLTAANGTIGNLTDADGTTAGIQLTGSAATINAAIADATFTATIDGAASIGISVTDGTVTTPTTGTLNLTASQPNNAPTIDGIASTAAVTTGVASALPDFTVADADAGDTLTVTLTAANGTIGNLTDADGTTAGIQLTGSATTINAAIADATFTATADGAAGIGISVTDGIVTTPTTGTLNLTATTPNVAPTIGGIASAAAVTTGVASALPDFTVADGNPGDTLTVTLTAANGTIGNLTDADGATAGIQLTGSATTINAAIAGATFTATADGAASIGISVTDGTVATPTTGTLNLTATTPNAAPTIAGIGATTTVGTGAASALPDFTVADGNPGDTLTVTLTAANGTIGNLTDADGATPGIQLTGPAAAINAAIAGATFTAAADGVASIGISVTDGRVVTPTTGTLALTAIRMNAAPTIDGIGSTAAVTTGVASALPDFTVADADAGDTLTVTLTAANGTIGNLTDADAATPGIQLTGPAAAINAAIAGATFTATADGAAGIGVSVTDGRVTAPTTGTLSIAASTPTTPPPNPPTDPTPPPQPPTDTDTVDGVPVQTGTTTNSDGTTSTTVTIPIVTPDRPEQVGNNTVADIPLVKAGDGTPLLAVQVPTGFGLQSSGSGQTKEAGQSVTDLIREIKAHTPAGSTDQTTLTGGGSEFLTSLPADAPLIVQTIVPAVSEGGAPDQPLVIAAPPEASGTPRTALVLDTRNLPPGTPIILKNVHFAAVIGPARVTGGDGTQIVWGDGGNQYLLLGADDDVLRGGDGDDFVGSRTGNDLLYGDAGNDTVSGGEGNDRLQGGTGDDSVLGGTGVDVVRVEAAFATVTLQRGAYGELTLSGAAVGTDALTEVELLRFDDRVELASIPAGIISTDGASLIAETLYLARNPDVADAVARGLFASGLDHYRQFGAAEGRLKPVALDGAFYLAQNPDVAAAVEQGRFESGLQHFLLFGEAEGRDPNALFDSAWYLGRYADVAAAVEAGTIGSAYEHFVTFGWKEGRNPSAWMDTDAYLKQNPDVAAAGIDPLAHFLDYGAREGRTVQANDTGLWMG